MNATASSVVTVSGFLPKTWAFGARKVVDVQVKGSSRSTEQESWGLCQVGDHESCLGDEAVEQVGPVLQGFEPVLDQAG